MPNTPANAKKPADRKPAAKKTSTAKQAPAQPADLAGDYVVETTKGTLVLTRYSQLPFGVTVEVHQLQKQTQAKIDEHDAKRAEVEAQLSELDLDDEDDAAQAEVLQGELDRAMAEVEAEAAMVEFEVVMLQLLAGADEENLALLKRLPQSEVGRIYHLWQRHAGVDLPESSAS